MPNPLESILYQHLQKEGYLSVHDFMNLALYHPQYGYYHCQPVFGPQGDYITAPEITQVFGEILAIWYLDYLERLPFKPQTLAFIELGPGRGTLMADILRIFQKFPSYYQALKVYLLEISPSLRSQQQEKLSSYPVAWVENLESIPASEVTLILANEFFDALPIEQYVQIDGKWQPRLIGLVEGKIDFLGPVDVPIRQECPGYASFLHRINHRLNCNPGAALLIDYGQDTDQMSASHGDTLQALYRHHYACPFTNIGQQDLSHAVDFGALRRLVDAKFKISLTSQSDFLLNLGLEVRVHQLCQKAEPKDALALKTAAVRLVSPREMGSLFKVLALESGQ